jgi:hypothetical protein
MWVNDSGGGYVTNTQFLSGDMPPDFDAWEIPSCWKLDPLVNDGYPYIDLMIDLPRIELNPVKQNDYICIFCPRQISGSTVYPQQDELLNGNGDVILCPVSCACDDSLNGMRAVNIVHPADTEGRYKYIRVGAIVRVMGQLYTVMNVDERWDGNSGQVSFYAETIFYQLNDKFIYPRLPGGTQISLIGFSGNHALEMIDTFTQDEAREGSHSYAFTHSSDIPQFPLFDYWKMPIENGCTPVEAILGAGGFIECKGGELYRNNFYFSINERMENASDCAFDIRIGKNLTGIRRIVDVSSMVTYFRAYDPWGGWFAIAWDFGEFFGDLFPHYVVRSQNFEFPSEAYDEESDWSYDEWFENVFIPQATAFFQKNGKPVVRYEINLEDVRKNPDFEIIGDENFRVGDKGRVWDSRFGDEPLTIEVTGTVYDGIRGKCTQVIIGDRQSFVQTAMPAVEWGTQPQIVAGGTPILDGNGDFLFDGDEYQIFQGVTINA